MADKLYAQLKDFSSGLNVKDGASLALETDLVDVKNAILGRGFIQKRHGYDVFATGPVTSTQVLWNQIGAKKWSEI